MHGLIIGKGGWLWCKEVLPNCTWDQKREGHSWQQQRKCQVTIAEVHFESYRRDLWCHWTGGSLSFGTQVICCYYYCTSRNNKYEFIPSSKCCLRFGYVDLVSLWNSLTLHASFGYCRIDKFGCFCGVCRWRSWNRTVKKVLGWNR